MCKSYSLLISPTPDLSSGGSGTLVRYKKLQGILTATHVVADYLDMNRIFSPIVKTRNSSFFLNDSIPVKEVIYLETSEGIEALRNEKFWPENTLDICLIQIEQNNFQDILNKSKKQVVDLSLYKKHYLSNHKKYCGYEHNHDWCIAFDGCPREQAKHTSQNILKTKFDGTYLSGGTYKSQNPTLVKPPFDKTADLGYHELGPTDDEIPIEFSGVSGAGVWQVSFQGNDGPEKIDEMFFSGIVVSEKKQKRLYSRGPTSLYEIFTEYLDKRTSS